MNIPDDAVETKIQAMAYLGENFFESHIEEVREIEALIESGDTLWVQLEGYGSAEKLSEIQKLFGLHHLALEDIVNGQQRAKLEPYDDSLFIVARVPHGGAGRTRQLNILLSERCLVTGFSGHDETLEPVRQRIRDSIGHIRDRGPDYLAYAILDTVVDSYYPVIEQYGERLEKLEMEVLRKPTQSTVHRIHAIKRSLLRLRRAIWPHREVVNTLLRDTDLITQDTTVYLRDCYDHLIRLVELLETLREVCSDLMSTYLSSLSNRMNEVMKVLTIIATIFIPLSFVAGVYGMNFDSSASDWNMPELQWVFGYPTVVGIMALIAGAMLFFFWRRGWFD
jgi:magnesium transporter